MSDALEKFLEDGHAPVRSGDVLDDRLVVIRKLGSGGFGTVYLTFSKAVDDDPKVRAAKVFRADQLESKKAELNVVKMISEQGRGEETKRKGYPFDLHLVKVLGDFNEDIEGTEHGVIEYEALRETLHNWYRTRPHTYSEIINAMHQILHGIGSLQMVNSCHSDLKPTNIMTCDHPDNQRDRARVPAMVMANNIPVDPETIPNWMNPVFADEYKSTKKYFMNSGLPRDFLELDEWKTPQEINGEGDSRYISQKPLLFKLVDIGSDHVSAPYLSPENITGNELKPPAMVWAAGCILFEITTKVPLFNMKERWPMSENPGAESTSSLVVGGQIILPGRVYEHLARMHHILETGGTVHRLTHEQYDYFNEFYKVKEKRDSKATLRYPISEGPTLKAMLDEKHRVDFSDVSDPEEALQTLHDLVKMMLILEPTERPNAIDLLEHPILFQRQVHGPIQFKVLANPQIPGDGEKATIVFAEKQDFLNWLQYLGNWMVPHQTDPKTGKESFYCRGRNACKRRMQLYPPTADSPGWKAVYGVFNRADANDYHNHSTLYEEKFTKEAKVFVDGLMDKGKSIYYIYHEMEKLYPQVTRMRIKNYVDYKELAQQKKQQQPQSHHQ